MLANLHFTQPAFLWLLPLALLPFISYGVKTFAYPSLANWPQDTVSKMIKWGIRALAGMTLAGLIIGASAPFTEGGTTTRVGKGSEIVVVLDRSGSMSEGLKGREYNRQSAEAHEDDSHFLSKIEASRQVLLKFMAQRPGDTFGMVAFNASAVGVAPLSADRDLAKAAMLSAQSQSTGFTALGRALEVALDYFENRPYTAKRLILLVSDGDAIIEPEQQAYLKHTLAERKVEVMWIYVRGEREPSIVDTVIAGDNEIITDADQNYADHARYDSMHEVFQQLGVPYQAFEVDSEDGFQRAIQAVSTATNKPTRYQFRLPRKDYGVYAYLLAALGIVMLILIKTSEVKVWRP